MLVFAESCKCGTQPFVDGSRPVYIWLDEKAATEAFLRARGAALAKQVLYFGVHLDGRHILHVR